jgi:isopenicillin N synthase-like dioxygenase
MTCVVVADSCGLDILDTEIFEWIEIEKFLQPGRDVVVFCAKIMELLSQEKYKAAIHRVSRNNQPRLSLVYEQRPSASLHISVREIRDSCTASDQRS